MPLFYLTQTLLMCILLCPLWYTFTLKELIIASKSIFSIQFCTCLFHYSNIGSLSLRDQPTSPPCWKTQCTLPFLRTHNNQMIRNIECAGTIVLTVLLPIKFCSNLCQAQQVAKCGACAFYITQHLIPTVAWCKQHALYFPNGWGCGIMLNDSQPMVES